MKKFVSFLLFVLFSSIGTFSLLSQMPAGTTNQPAGSPELGGLDDEALEWFNEFFSQFSDEELAFFAKEGEKYIEDEMAKGKDIDTIINEVFEPFEELPAGKPIEPQPAGVPVPAPLAPIADSKKIDEARVLLKTIADKIEAIRHRAEHDRKSRELLAPWRFNIDDLIYYTHQLSQEKLIKYIPEKEFADLFDALRQLAQELSFYEPLYHVPQTVIEVENPYEVFGLTPAASLDDVQEQYQSLMAEKSPEFIKKKMAGLGKSQDEIKLALANVATEREALTQSYSTITAQEQSRKTLHAILDGLARAIYTNDIFGKIKKLMQKYEPEALKIKEAQEKREAAARQEQEKLLKMMPKWTPPVREPLTDYGFAGTPDYKIKDKGEIGIQPYSPTTTGAGVAPEIGKPGAPAGAPGKAGEKGKEDKAKKEGAKEGEKKKEEDKKKRKLPEVSKKVIEKDKKIEGALDKLAEYFNESLPAERSFIPDVPRKEWVKDFSATLQRSIPGYSKTDPEYGKTKEIKGMLGEVWNKLYDLKQEIRNTKDLNKQEKAQFKKSASERFSKFSKDYLTKYMSDVLSTHLTDDLKLITPGGDKDIPREKKYIFFGIDEFDDINADANKNIKDLNEPRVLSDGTLVVRNTIKDLKEIIAEIQKELKSSN